MWKSSKYLKSKWNLQGTLVGKDDESAVSNLSLHLPAAQRLVLDSLVAQTDALPPPGRPRPWRCTTCSLLCCNCKASVVAERRPGVHIALYPNEQRAYEASAPAVCWKYLYCSERHSGLQSSFSVWQRAEKKKNTCASLSWWHVRKLSVQP